MNQKTFKIVNDDISDGYHTFDELYEHRNLLFLLLCRMTAYEQANVQWMREHYPEWDGVFLTIGGMQISYHVPKYYRKVYENFREVKDSPWDGHTPQDVITRLESLVGYERP